MISRADYWDHPAVSQSDLKLFNESAFHYWAAKIAKITPPKDTRTLRKGRALHAALFEPDDFDLRFPRFDEKLQKKSAKEAHKALEAQAAELDGCVIRDMDEVLGMVKALRANRAVMKLISLITEAERPVLWDCEETGVQCRARLDGIGDRILLDLKSTSKIPTRANLERAVADYGYAFQMAHYDAAARSIDGAERERWLVFVESALPHAVCAYPLGRASLEVEDRRRIALLGELAERRESGRWDFQEDVQPLELPEWHMRKIA